MKVGANISFDGAVLGLKEIVVDGDNVSFIPEFVGSTLGAFESGEGLRVKLWADDGLFEGVGIVGDMDIRKRVDSKVEVEIAILLSNNRFRISIVRGK